MSQYLGCVVATGHNEYGTVAVLKKQQNIKLVKIDGLKHEDVELGKHLYLSESNVNLVEGVIILREPVFGETTVYVSIYKKVSKPLIRKN